MRKSKKENENKNALEVVVTANGYRLGEIELVHNHNNVGEPPKDPINESLLKRNAQALALELTTGNNERRQAILDVLKQFYSHDKGSIIKYFGIEPFIAVLRSGDIQQVVIVLEFLAMGLTSASLHQSFIDYGGFYLLTSILSSSSPSPSATSSSSASSLASPSPPSLHSTFPYISRIFLNMTLYTKENNEAILSSGALPLLVRSVALRIPGCIEALYVIAKVSHETSACRTAVIIAGAVQIVLDLIHKQTNGERRMEEQVGGMLDATLLKRHAAYALYNLVQDTGAALEVLSGDGISSLSLLLDHSDTETGMWARRTLSYIASLNSPTMKLNGDMGKGIVWCLKMKHIDVGVLAAVSALTWENEANCNILGSLGAVEPLVDILKKKEEVEDTTRALWCLLSDHSENQHRAVAAGAIPVLTDQMRNILVQMGPHMKQSHSNGTEDSHSETLSLICCLLGNPYNDDLFVKEGGIQLLTSLISPKHSYLDQEDALDGLHTLGKRNQQYLNMIGSDVSVFLSMAVLIQRGTKKARTTIKCLIILMASAGIPIPASVAPAIIPPFAEDVMDERPLPQAVVVLVRLAEDSIANCEKIVAQGVIPHAVQLAQSVSSQEQYVAAKLLLVLYKVPSSRSEICEPSAARCVLGLLRFSGTLNSDTKTTVSLFMRDLSKQDLVKRELIVRQGGVRFLLSQLAPKVGVDEQTAALRALRSLTLLGAEDLRGNKGEDLVNYILRQYNEVKAFKEPRETSSPPPQAINLVQVEANVRRAVRALWVYAMPSTNRVCLTTSDLGMWQTIGNMFHSIRSDIGALFYLIAEMYKPEVKHCLGCNCKSDIAYTSIATMKPSIPDEHNFDKHLTLLSSMCTVVMGSVEQRVDGHNVGLYIITKFAKCIPKPVFADYQHLSALRMIMLVLTLCSEGTIVVALNYLLYLIKSNIRSSPDLKMLLSILSAYEEHESANVRNSVGLCLRESILQYPNMETVAQQLNKLDLEVKRQRTDRLLLQDYNNTRKELEK